MSEISEELSARAERVYDLLDQCYPGADCELDFETPFQLLVATVLSAQSTDRRVNEVTKALFARFPSPEAMAGADRAEVEEIIRPVGFQRAKAASLIGLSGDLVTSFGGRVPATLEELGSLPGVGRKTANVVLGNAFGTPGLSTDTHFMRISRRLGFTQAAKPEVVEADLALLYPPEKWVKVSHLYIWHGRRRCHARNPACGACPLSFLCPSFGEGPTDPTKAAALIREPRR